MIIVQTPLRVSLFGGGTDFPSYFEEEGGAVMSFTIDKYIFVTIKQRFDEKVRVGYTRTEMVDSVDRLQHELIREALCLTGIRKGVEITTMGDIPSAGSGLGSSSTVTVGALQAMYAYLGELVLAERLAREACEIELSRLGKPIGVQDQYIVAYGGLRLIEFHPDRRVECHRIEVDDYQLRQLNQNFLLFFTGTTRKSSSILSEQKDNIRERRAVLREMRALAYEARERLAAGDMDSIGCLLDQGWQLKKQLASRISNGDIDAIYETARRAGARGGKITGAGGGGFFLCYCPEGTQERVRQALHKLRELPFGVERDGSKVIFNYQR